MITFAFVTFAIINAIMLIALLGIIYVKNTTDKDDLAQQLEKVQDGLVLGLFVGIVAIIVLSVFLIL